MVKVNFSKVRKWKQLNSLDPSRSARSRRRRVYPASGFSELEVEILAEAPLDLRSSWVRQVCARRKEQVEDLMLAYGWSWGHAVRAISAEKMNRTIWDVLSDT